MKPQQDFIVAGQFVELGQVSELTLGGCCNAVEGSSRFMYVDEYGW